MNIFWTRFFHWSASFRLGTGQGMKLLSQSVAIDFTSSISALSCSVARNTLFQHLAIFLLVLGDQMSQMCSQSCGWWSVWVESCSVFPTLSPVCWDQCTTKAAPCTEWSISDVYWLCAVWQTQPDVTDHLVGNVISDWTWLWSVYISYLIQHISYEIANNNMNVYFCFKYLFTVA